MLLLIAFCKSELLLIHAQCRNITVLFGFLHEDTFGGIGFKPRSFMLHPEYFVGVCEHGSPNVTF